MNRPQTVTWFCLICHLLWLSHGDILGQARGECEYCKVCGALGSFFPLFIHLFVIVIFEGCSFSLGLVSVEFINLPSRCFIMTPNLFSCSLPSYDFTCYILKLSFTKTANTTDSPGATPTVPTQPAPTVPIVGSSSSTPLHFVAANGHTTIICTLLLHGTHADRADKSGVTPEMSVVELGSNASTRPVLC